MIKLYRKFCSKLEIDSREWLNQYLAPRRLSMIKGYEDFTIISNTCWAGHVYRYFGLPYNTPTIGVGFFADDYLKFVSNLKEYLSLDLEMISAKDSKYYDYIIRNQPVKFHNCPYARLGDIELRFAHYKSPEEAKNNWNRRKERVNYDNLIVKFSEHMGCSYEHLCTFDSLPYEKKLVFVTKDYGLKSQVISTEYIGREDVKDDTLHFRRYVDLISLIKGKPFAINQPK